MYVKLFYALFYDILNNDDDDDDDDDDHTVVPMRSASLLRVGNTIVYVSSFMRSLGVTNGRIREYVLLRLCPVVMPATLLNTRSIVLSHRRIVNYSQCRHADENDEHFSPGVSLCMATARWNDI